MELGYLTHIVFRVLQRPNSDATQPSSYRVQVLVSPGIQHHQIVCDAATASARWQLDATPAENAQEMLDALTAAQPLILASSSDLTLEEVDTFLAGVLSSSDDEHTEGYASATKSDKKGKKSGAKKGGGSRAACESIR